MTVTVRTRRFKEASPSLTSLIIADIQSDWTEMAAEWAIVPALGGDMDTFTRHQTFIKENHMHLSSLEDTENIEAEANEVKPVEPPRDEGLPNQLEQLWESAWDVSTHENDSKNSSSHPPSPCLPDPLPSSSSSRAPVAWAPSLVKEISSDLSSGRVLPRDVSLGRSFFSPFRSTYSSKVLGSQSSGSPLASPSNSNRDISQFYRSPGPSSNPLVPSSTLLEEASPIQQNLPPQQRVLPALATTFSRLSMEKSSSMLRIALLKEESSSSLMNRRSTLPGGLQGGHPSLDKLPDPGDRPADRQLLPPILSQQAIGKERGKTSIIADRASSATLDSLNSPTSPSDPFRRQNSSGVSARGGISAFGRTQALKKSLTKSLKARFSDMGGVKHLSIDITVEPESLVTPLMTMPEVTERSPRPAVLEEQQAPLKPKPTLAQYSIAATTMQRIVDRANSQGTELVLQEGNWAPSGNIVTSQHLGRFSRDLELQSYREVAESMLSSGKVAIQLLASNDYALVPFGTDSSDGKPSHKYLDLWSLDPHDLIDPSRGLLKNQQGVKAGLGVRFLATSAAEASRSLPGSNAHLKLVIHCTKTLRDTVVSDLASRSFCGYNPSNIILVVQDANHDGYLFKENDARFEKQELSLQTAPATRGNGFSMLLMSSPGCCWSMGNDGALGRTHLSAIDILSQWGVDWLITSSLQDLNPPNISIASLAALAYARVRAKTGVISEAVIEPSMVLARRHEGIFLSRKDDSSDVSCTCNVLPRDFALGTEAHKAVTGYVHDVHPIPCSNGRYFWHLQSLKSVLEASTSVFIPRLTLSSHTNTPTLVNATLEMSDLLPFMPHPQIRESKGRHLVVGKNGAASPALAQTTRFQDSQFTNALMERRNPIQSPRRIYIVLVEKNQALAQMAINLAMMLATHEDEIRLVSVRASDLDRSSGKDALVALGDQVRFSVPTPVREVALGLSTGEEKLLDVLEHYATSCASSVSNPDIEGSVIMIVGCSKWTQENESTALSIIRRLASKLPVVLVTANNESSIGSFSSLAVSPTRASVKAAILAFDMPTSKNTVELFLNNGLLHGDRGDELTLFSTPGSGKQAMVESISRTAQSSKVAFLPPFVLDLPQGVSLSSPLGIPGIEESINSGLEETRAAILAVPLPTGRLPPSVLSLISSSRSALLFRIYGQQ